MAPPKTPCIFCDIAAGRGDASTVYADDDVVAFLDIYPMRTGHTLIVPAAHATWLSDVPSAVRDRLFERATAIADAMRRSALPCDDVNIVLNDGPAANQTVPHVHVHVIPRVRGDLPKLLRKLVQRPIQAVLGGPRRALLDDQAKLIAQQLAIPGPLG